MSKQTDYGILLLTHFARNGEGSTYSARGLALEAHLPVPMVSKILKLLAREGLLVSQRGAKGGYALARRAEKISIAEIISAMEGPIAMTECVDAPGDCRQEPTCAVRSNWQKINRVVSEALGQISLSDMTTPLTNRLVALSSGLSIRPEA
ncbi:MAG: SUF system Fe-S cluster assembly regulator [Acidobacteriota bacterium]